MAHIFSSKCLNINIHTYKSMSAAFWLTSPDILQQYIRRARYFTNKYHNLFTRRKQNITKGAPPAYKRLNKIKSYRGAPTKISMNSTSLPLRDRLTFEQNI